MLDTLHQPLLFILGGWMLIKNIGIEDLNANSLGKYVRETILLIYVLVFKWYKDCGLGLKVLLLVNLLWFSNNLISH